MNIKELLKSELHYKILKFFKENPSSLETIKGITSWIGENKHKVKEAVDEIEKHNFLIKHESDDVTGYGLTYDEKLIKKLDKYLKK